MGSYRRSRYRTPEGRMVEEKSYTTSSGRRVIVSRRYVGGRRRSGRGGISKEEWERVEQERFQREEKIRIEEERQTKVKTARRETEEKARERIEQRKLAESERAMERVRFIRKPVGVARRETIQDYVPEEFRVKGYSPETVKALEFFFGETGKKYVGVDITPKIFPSIEKRDVTFQQIKDVIKKTPDIKIPVTTPLAEAGIVPRKREFDIGFPIRVGAEFIPTTPGEVGIMGGLVAGAIFAPPIVGAGIGVGVAGLGVRQALDIGLTPEERMAGAIAAGMGATGAAFGAAPFVKGLRARVSPEYFPVRVQPEGFRAVEIGDILRVTERIGLIPAKAPLRAGITTEVALPKISPLKRGGFEVKPFEKELFIGKEQMLATSQRELFRVGQEIAIEKPLYVTPEEPFLGIPITRVSRLGLVDPFKFPKDVKIGFGLPEKPQIGVIKGMEVARRETAMAFEIGKGAELEAIKTYGLITGVERRGVTVIRGQEVELYGFRIKEGIRPRGLAPKDLLPSTEEFTRVSGEITIGAGLIRPTKTIPIKITPTIPITRLLSIETMPTTRRRPLVSFPVSPPISPFPSPQISPPISPLISPPGSPPPSPPVSPLISLPFFPPGKPPAPMKFPWFGVPEFLGDMRGMRLFKDVPSLRAVLGGELGLKPVKPMKELEITGLVERPFKKVKLPTTMLLKTKKLKMKKPTEYYI